MRLPFLVLVALAPLDACSDTLVTAPTPEITVPTAPAPIVVIRGAKVPQEALIIIDGAVIRLGEFNAAEIERVEIIKRLAAATIYGSETRCPAIVVHTTPQTFLQTERNIAKQ